jgi:hypothetical protein
MNRPTRHNRDRRLSPRDAGDADAAGSRKAALSHRPVPASPLRGSGSINDQTINKDNPDYDQVGSAVATITGIPTVTAGPAQAVVLKHQRIVVDTCTDVPSGPIEVLLVDAWGHSPRRGSLRVRRSRIAASASRPRKPRLHRALVQQNSSCAASGMRSSKPSGKPGHPSAPTSSNRPPPPQQPRLPDTQRGRSNLEDQTTTDIRGLTEISSLSGSRDTDAGGLIGRVDGELRSRCA